MHGPRDWAPIGVGVLAVALVTEIHVIGLTPLKDEVWPKDVNRERSCLLDCRKGILVPN